MKVLDSDQDEVLSDGRWVHSLDHIPSFDVAFFLADSEGLLLSWGLPFSDRQQKSTSMLLADQQNR
jgi:hypothetical protein